jgi:hypothetical protein
MTCAGTSRIPAPPACRGTLSPLSGGTGPRGPSPRAACSAVRRSSVTPSAWRTEARATPQVFLAPIRMPPTRTPSGGAPQQAGTRAAARTDGSAVDPPSPTEFAGDPAAAPGAPPAPAPSRRPGVTPSATLPAADSCPARTPDHGGRATFPYASDATLQIVNLIAPPRLQRDGEGFFLALRRFPCDRPPMRVTICLAPYPKREF